MQGSIITEDDSKQWTERWSELDSVPVAHGFISKIAIDSIFSRDLKYNCLKIESGVNNDGKPKLIISGDRKEAVQVRFLSQPDKITFISTDITCPHDCQ